MAWLDLIRAQGPLLVPKSAHGGIEGSTGEGDRWRFLYFCHMRVGEGCMGVKAKRKKKSRLDPLPQDCERALLGKCCLIVHSFEGHRCPSAETHLNSTNSKVHSQLVKPQALWETLSLTPQWCFPSELLQYLPLVCTRLERGKGTFPWCQALYKVVFNLHNPPVG